MNKWGIYEVLKGNKEINIKEIEKIPAEETKEGLVEFLSAQSRRITERLRAEMYMHMDVHGIEDERTVKKSQELDQAILREMTSKYHVSWEEFLEKVVEIYFRGNYTAKEAIAKAKEELRGIEEVSVTCPISGIKHLILKAVPNYIEYSEWTKKLIIEQYVSQTDVQTVVTYMDKVRR
jgi:hypothetical protein